MNKKMKEKSANSNEIGKTVGEALKIKRQEMNLSLKGVENATSIRIIYLQAIEEGKIDKVISSVYAEGFIRQYANFLGLDIENVLRRNNSFPKTNKQQESLFKIDPFEVRQTSESKIKWLPNLLWGSLFLVLIVAAWIFAKYLEVI